MAKHKIKLLNQSGCLSREAIIAWKNNALSPIEVTSMENHLAHCSLCSDALEGFSEYSNIDPKVALDRLDNAFADTIKKKTRFSSSRRIYFGFAVAAILLVLFGVFGILKIAIFKNESSIAQQITPNSDTKPLATVTDKPTDNNQISNESSAKKILTSKPNSGSTPKDLKLPEENNKMDSQSAEEIAVTNEEAYEPVQETLQNHDAIADKKEEKPGVSISPELSAPQMASKRSTEKSIFKKSNERMSLSNKTNVNPETETVFYVVENPPRFQGGDLITFANYILNQLTISPEDQNIPLTSQILTSFTVDEKGKVNDVVIMKGINASIDSSVINIIRNAPSWQPGKQGGMAVKVKFTLPIRIDFQK
jgi:hypothetical protein